MAGWQIALQLLALCLIGGSFAFSDTGRYFVTAPKTAVPGTPYRLTVQVFDPPSPVHFSAYIERNNGYVNHQQTYVTVTPVASSTVVAGSVQTLTIQIPDDIWNSQYRSYRLHVRGTGGLQIEETYSVRVETVIASIFVQTDKDTYQPGETVTFKTFALYNANLKPYTGGYDVTLKAGNVVLNKWRASSGTYISTFHYDLDTHTIPGRWTIATSSSVTGNQNQYFQVAATQSAMTNAAGSENSAIDVKVHLPKTTNSSTPLTGYFEASYPMGVGVKGTAEVVINGDVQGYSAKKIIQFNGNASFTFPYTELMASNTQVKVKVTEDETGVTGSSESRVQVYERDLKIEFTEQTPAVFKPKLPFTAYVKISNHADEPLHIPADSVFSTVYVYGVGHYNRPAPQHSHFGLSSFTGTYPILARKLTLPDSGLFSIDLDIPDDVTSVDLMVTFQSLQKKLSLTRAAHSDANSYLQLSLLHDIPAVTDTQGADARFRVLSSQPLSDLTVELVSRGQVVSTVQPTLTSRSSSGDAYSAEFTVTLTWDMTPVTEVIAYHIVESGHLIQEVVTDSMALNVHGLLENTVAVTVSQQRVEPGQEVVLHVQARPGSSVGVLVEENNGASVQLLTPESVARKVEKASLKPLTSNAAKATTQKYSGATFSTANVLWMTGGHLANSPSTTSPVSQTAYNGASSSTGEAPNAIFLGTNATGPDGRATFTVRLPDSVTTWSVTGFAFDPAGHVGVVDQPLLIEAVHEVYGELLGPDHVVSGEHVILTAYVHNTRDVESQVTVTLRPKENVEILSVTAEGIAVQTTTQEKHQIVTVPARNSKQVFFSVTSSPGVPSYATNAHLKLVVRSGTSKQIVPYSYTVVPAGVEQTFTSSSITDVHGSATGDLSISAPKEALPGTITRRITVTDDFDDLVLPLALGEDDVMEEGTGPAALLHLALPVMMAKAHPDLLDQLKGPIERGYQRLMSFTNGYGFRVYPQQSISKDWLVIAAMRTLAEAKDYVFVDEQEVTKILFRYYSYSLYNNGVVLTNAINQQDFSPMTSRVSLEAFAGLAVQNLENHIVGSLTSNQHDEYRRILDKVNVFLLADHSSAQDPLSLSYLALANLHYGNNATGLHRLSQLMAMQDGSHGNPDEIFWNTGGNDTVNYYGDFQPGRHVAESRDLVTAANALRALVYSGQDQLADRVAKWLIRHRNGNGLFKTAWDTLAATEALLAYGARVKASNTRLHLDTPLASRHSDKWLTQGLMTNFTATGQGKVFSQMEVKYHVTDELGDESFEVVPVVLDESLNHFKLMVCSRWLLADQTSGITTQDVTVPSGFLADATGLSSQAGVMTYIRRNDTTITVFFQRVEKDSTCYTLPVNRIHPVARTSAAYIVTKSFNTPENYDLVAYHPRRLMESTVCDLCPTCCPSP